MKSSKKSAVGETKKERRRRLLRTARTSNDPRERMHATVLLDEMAMASAQKDGVAVVFKGATKRESIARLQSQAINHTDPAVRLRAQDALREMQGATR
jgi:hypothetical protein